MRGRRYYQRAGYHFLCYDLTNEQGVYVVCLAKKEPFSTKALRSANPVLDEPGDVWLETGESDKAVIDELLGTM